jgi:hypothetical protein
VQAEACDVGVLAQDIRCELAPVAVERVAQEVVRALSRAALCELAFGEQLRQRGPAGQAVLECERVLDLA